MASSKIEIAPFQSTPIASLTSTSSLIRTTYTTQKTKPIEYRIKQLRQLYWGLVDNNEALNESCRLDLGKSVFETSISETDWCTNYIIYVLKNLQAWMKDEPAPDIPLQYKVLSPTIRKEPLGAVLIIGCWNFPVQLSITPLIGAIAAGCTAILKPSEVSPHTAMVLKKIVEESLDPDSYAVVNGGAEETTVLLNEKWEKIFYTGNSNVATIIAKKAAETLTPLTLELGGRNPAIVTKNADLRLAARRLLWGKTINAGQVCLGHNYILVEAGKVDQLVEEFKIAIKEFYPNGTKLSPDYCRIVNSRHFNRIKKMLDDTQGKIVMGGEVDESQNYIEPTIIIVSSQDDSTVRDESFGPLVPILPYENLDEAIRIANSVDSTPLALYPFGNKQEVKKILSEIASGGASVNDSFFHGSISTLAFGGVGNSGQGSYRGRASFDNFTHRRSITTTPGWIEKLVSIRYPPYALKLGKIRASGYQKPNFDRSGNTIYSISYWLGFLFSLGADGLKGGLLRWAAILALSFGARRYLDSRSGLPSYLK